MPIRNCAVIAVEGPHASGKTTLVHALTSHYREQGIHVTATGEAARHSPFMHHPLTRRTAMRMLVPAETPALRIPPGSGRCP
ncbi:hypothetical protein [Actinomadura formosensis]|uniref:hypothetical protein n=1 Tax=Actinomadura formosensis TaxID=60706 RepID=UPI003D93BC8D